MNKRFNLQAASVFFHFFLVASCCSQGATLLVNLWCRRVLCLSVHDRTPCPLPSPPHTWFLGSSGNFKQLTILDFFFPFFFTSIFSSIYELWVMGEARLDTILPSILVCLLSGQELTRANFPKMADLRVQAKFAKTKKHFKNFACALANSWPNIDLWVVPFATTVLASENLWRVLEPLQILTYEHSQLHPSQVNFNLRVLASRLRNWSGLRVHLRIANAKVLPFLRVIWSLWKKHSAVALSNCQEQTRRSPRTAQLFFFCWTFWSETYSLEQKPASCPASMWPWSCDRSWHLSSSHTTNCIAFLSFTLSVCATPDNFPKQFWKAHKCLNNFVCPPLANWRPNFLKICANVCESECHFCVHHEPSLICEHGRQHRFPHSWHI